MRLRLRILGFWLQKVLENILVFKWGLVLGTGFYWHYKKCDLHGVQFFPLITPVRGLF
jgi:hypothetical protein